MHRKLYISPEFEYLRIDIEDRVLDPLAGSDIIPNTNPSESDVTKDTQDIEDF